MKKIVVVFITIFLLSSCNKEFNRAMKSADKTYILEVFEKEYEKKKWENVLTLSDHVKKLVAGTDDVKNLIYKTAYANYYDKNYRLAGNQFKNYALSYINDSLAESTLYLSAKCYYEGSLQYNLDQVNTNLAIKEMQNFVDKYPNSAKVKDANAVINELVVRNEKKAFENAKTLYNIGQYKASSISFDNVIQDYPDTKFKEELMVYILRSKTNLAKESVFELKKERIIEAQTAYRNFLQTFPDTSFKKEAENLKSDLENEMVSVNEQTEKIQERIKNNKQKSST